MRRVEKFTKHIKRFSVAQNEKSVHNVLVIIGLAFKTF